MKKFILQFVLVLVSCASYGQYTLEKNYVNLVSYTKVDDNNYKFVEFDSAQLKINIYSLNHTLEKTLYLPSTPSGQRLNGCLFITRYTFNKDDNYEYALNYINKINYNPVCVICNEDGSTIMQIQGVYFPDIFNTPAGTKMLAYSYTDHTTKVYSLPGTLPQSVKEVNKDNNENNVFPNPAMDVVVIKHNLPLSGSSAELIVTDVNGKPVKTINADLSTDVIRVNTSDMTNGMYFYTLSAGTVVRTGNFLIQR